MVITSRMIQDWWQSFYYADWRRSRLPVFNLPGKMHGESITHRVYNKIPYGKPLLLSPINWISVDGQEERLRKDAKDEIDIIDPDILSVLLDEQIALVTERVDSGFFKLNGRKAFSDGYWTYITDLEPGSHVIRTFGSCRSGHIQIAMKYALHIADLS